MPSLSVIALCYIVSRIGTGLFLFNLYNYTAVAYPTRIRAMAFAWTDGLGHLGAWGGVTLLGPLYLLGPNHLGWILWIVVPGALLPAVLIRGLGIKQSGRCWSRSRRDATDCRRHRGPGRPSARCNTGAAGGPRPRGRYLGGGAAG